MSIPGRISWYLAAFLLAVPLNAPTAETIDQITAIGEQRIGEGQAAQEAIDRLSEQSDALVSQYKQVIKVVDGLKVYNSLLQKQVYNQTAEMTAMQTSIDEVSVIERQIIPLMVRMIDSLEDFIRLDVPFLTEERNGRIARLRQMMERSDVEAAEKFRRVIEAYQIENDYGRTIEAYKGTLELEGGSREVDFLRIGRVALLYQSADREHSGAWNKASGEWQTLPPEQYKQDIAKGLRIARKQIAPDLLVLPIPAAEGVAR
jgi:hypothetical protein